MSSLDEYFSIAYVLEMLKQACPACGKYLEAEEICDCQVEPARTLVADEDYYFEAGLMVFTASYHLRRGYCCKSGCRHCPYGFTAE